jgi:predicted ester cyclase
MLYKHGLVVIVLGAALLAPTAGYGQDNKALVRRLLEEGAGKGNLTVVDEVVAPTFVGRSVAPGMEVKGPEGVKQRFTQLRMAFPDMQVTVEELVAEGDKVATRTTSRGTHKGEFQGIAPSGKAVTWTTLTLGQWANGKLQEGWLTSDLLQQLRAAPPPGPASR